MSYKKQLKDATICDDYWEKKIEAIELKSKIKTHKKLIKNTDFSKVLPPKLRERVANIIPYTYDECDRTLFAGAADIDGYSSGKEDDDDTPKKKDKKVAFNESTCSDIIRLENEFPHFELKLDLPLDRKEKSQKSDSNWIADYICKPRKDRVKWDSKVYNMTRSLFEKSLDEQAEEIMEASAERFSKWLNDLGTNHETDISKEQLKALFSIEGERRLLASIQTEPKEVKAIAKTVADKWNLPEMAIELKYEKYLRERLKEPPKKAVKVAFGRTVPQKYLPWVPTPTDTKITTVFPDELLSGEKLFKGIAHLRSVKLLIDFCRAHPNVEKPRYLVDNGFFDESTKKTIKTDVPLYEKLKLKY